MQIVPLSQIPNQTVTFTADGNVWRVKLFLAITYMLADITINSVTVMRSVNCWQGRLLLPFSYQYETIGNLVFSEDADYGNFGNTCLFYYLSSAEVKTFQTTLYKDYLGSKIDFLQSVAEDMASSKALGS